MSWTYWPVNSIDEIQDYRMWDELQEGINERCDAAGVGRLNLPIASGYDGMFRLAGIEAVCGKINELLGHYCDHEKIEDGTAEELGIYDEIAFDVLSRRTIDGVGVLNEMWCAVDKMRWVVVGMGAQTAERSTSVDGDRAQRHVGLPYMWDRGYGSKAAAMSAYPGMSTYENWNDMRNVYKETGLSWAYGTIFAGAKLGTLPGYDTTKWYGLFDADWGYVTSDEDVEESRIAGGDLVLLAKLSRSFWTIGRFGWKTYGPQFDGYEFIHPDGLVEGRWLEWGVADRWEWKRPVSERTYNPCTTFPGEQNWSINTRQYYLDNFGEDRNDAAWVAKMDFDKAR